MTLYYKNNKATIWQLLARIVAFSIQSLVYLPSLSSRLLLRNIPNFFDYYGSSSMCLSSRNRSNSKAFHHILPCIAPVCEGMHYHKTGVPWQTNSILITIKFLLQCRDLPRFARFFAVFILYTYHADINRIGKTGQNVALCTTQL